MGSNTFDRPDYRCVQPKDMTDYNPHWKSKAPIHKTAKIGDACTIGPKAQIDKNVTIGAGCHILGKVCEGATIGTNIFVPEGTTVAQGTNIPSNTKKQRVRDFYLHYANNSLA